MTAGTSTGARRLVPAAARAHTAPAQRISAMAGFRIPGPLTGFMPDGSPLRIDDGTAPLWAVPAPGPVCTSLHCRPLVEASLHDLSWRDADDVARHVWQALVMAAPRVPARVLQRTGVMLEGVLDALLPALLVAMGVLAAGITLGSLVGGAIGLLVGGVSALPGAVLGADLGLAFANALLVWAGLGFLVSEIAGGLPEMSRLAERGVRRAAAVHGKAAGDPAWQLSAAADDLAEAAALFIVLVLQGIVAWLLRKPAIAAMRGATGSIGRAAGSIRTGEATAAADAAVAELVGRLRASRFGEGFAKWVEGNWRELVGNPRLQISAAAGKNKGSFTADASRSSTPSRLPEDSVQGKKPESSSGKKTSSNQAGSTGSEKKAETVGSFWSSAKNKSATENALGHWNKHKGEFPELASFEDYAAAARSLAEKQPAGAWVKKRGADTLIYDSATNTFLVKNAQGMPRTMFRPKDGVNYWNMQ